MPGVISTKCCIHCDEYDPKTNCAHCFKPKVDPRFPMLGRRVCPLNVPCGLHIVGTERHEARRIDNQLRGRSGRQGDPGSSRFFLSLQDDLMRLFMGEKMIALLERLGMTGGMALDDRHVSKAIERAQKKVEERNFGIRKNLLEYDEVWDYQRRDFYKRRQRVLEGERLEDLIWEMIDETIEQAVVTFLDPDFRRQSVAQWAREKLGIPIDASRIEADDLELAIESIRDQAREEARTTISRSVGEYIDPELDRSEWDLRGLSKWAVRYGTTISQNQLRRMEAEDIEELVMSAAADQIETADLSGMEPLLDANYPVSRLAEWARLQFGVEVREEDLTGGEGETGSATRAMQLTVRQAYRRREVTYPVEELLDATFGPDAVGDGAYAADRIVRWTNAKFNAGWKIEDVQGKNPRQLYEELVALNEEWLGNGRLAEEIDRAVAEHEGDDLVVWARRRFGAALENEDELLDGEDGDPREALMRAGRLLLRYELTRLEQVVLTTVLDDEWKDHMYEMDLLKSAIGLRGYAEKDPKVEYKREGMRMYGEMMDRLHERVTQTIFRARLGGGVSSAYRGIETHHDEATNVGFSEAQAEGLGPQGEAARPQTFRREKPKVGRNDPCPCGSGKKYKKCCGR